jgi:hypothetical protein
MWDTTSLDEMCRLGSKVCRSKAAVSHISRKTSEMWGTHSFVAEPDLDREPGYETSEFAALISALMYP